MIGRLFAGLIVLFVLRPGILAAEPAELVMFWEPGCSWCQAWEREVGEIYPRTPEAEVAPLRRVRLERPMPPALANDREGGSRDC